MTEELYGREEREHSAGYTPMPLVSPIPKENWDDTSAPAPDDTYRPISPAEAANELLQKRSQPDQQTDREPPPVEQPPIPVEYLQQFGENAGQRMPDNQVISAEQAAHDLARWRESVGQTIEDAERQQLQETVDALRGEQQQQPVAEQQAAQPQETQPEQPVQEDRNQKVQRMLQDPDFLAAAQEQIATQTAQAEQARQTYEAAVLQNAHVTLANISARHPELRNVGLDQWPVVLQTLQASNPQRFQQISQELQGTRDNLTQAAQVMERQQQQYQAQMHQAASQMQQRFNNAARDSDASFEEYRKAQGISDAHLKEIQKEAFAGLRESGMTDEQIATAWNTDWTLRSFPAQRMMMESALYRLGKRGLAQRVAPKPVPPVQRPGSPQEIASAKDYSTRELSAKLSHSGSLKDAAALLQARRANKR
jgi:hypothetical protein